MLESLLASFAEKEVSKHPELVADAVTHILQANKVAPDITQDVHDFLVKVIPLIIAEIQAKK